MTIQSLSGSRAEIQKKETILPLNLSSSEKRERKKIFIENFCPTKIFTKFSKKPFL